jgi:hypothetical protein
MPRKKEGPKNTKTDPQNQQPKQPETGQKPNTNKQKQTNTGQKQIETKQKQDRTENTDSTERQETKEPQNTNTGTHTKPKPQKSTHKHETKPHNPATRGPKKVTILCDHDKSQSIMIEEGDTPAQVRAKVQDVVLRGNTKYRITLNGKDIERTKGSIFDAADNESHLQIKDILEGGSGGPTDRSSSDEEDPNKGDTEEDEGDSEGTIYSEVKDELTDEAETNDINLAERMAKQQSKPRGQTKKRKKDKTGRMINGIETDFYQETNAGQLYNTCCNLRFEGQEEEVIHLLGQYLPIFRDAGSQRAYDNNRSINDINHNVASSMIITIEVPRPGTAKSHFVLQGTGTMMGTNLCQTQMYQLKAICNDIWTRINEGTEYTKLMTLNQINRE